jgi:hypothetical protein
VQQISEVAKVTNPGGNGGDTNNSPSRPSSENPQKSVQRPNIRPDTGEWSAKSTEPDTEKRKKKDKKKKKGS